LVFLLLGPLEARLDGEPLLLGGGRQRSLLAVLLLHANEVVSREQLIDAVWGAERPSTIAAALNVHLSKLRRLLAVGGTDVALVTAPHGYALRIDPDRLDLNRFERLLRDGREALLAGQAGVAAATLDEALALWRGPPLDELDLGASVETAVGRLCELHLIGLEDRFEAGLQLGRHAELVPELEAFVREHPLHERARAQLMVALYRSGRQSDALQTYRDARRLLAEELGLDPGPELQRLEKAILVQDPSLFGPDSRRSLRRGRARRLVVTPALVIAAVTAILSLGPSGPPVRGPEPLADVVLARASDVAIVQPETNKVVARVPVGSSPALIREGDGSVWVADRLDLTVTEIDPESRRVLRTIGIGFRPDDIAARNGAVWAFDREDRVLARLGDGQTWDRFQHPDFGSVEQMALDDEAVWLAGGTRLIRVDAATGEIVSNASVPARVDGLALGGDDVWAVSGSAAAVFRIDPRTSQIRDRIPLGGESGGTAESLVISADTKFVWVLNSGTATVTKIDPTLRDAVETYRLGVGRGSLSLAAGEGAAWIGNAFDGTVTRIDATTNEVASISVSAYYRPKGVTVAGGLVWVSVDDDRA
jgi:DNA-binding SARP family transcriptional activator/DNA-binding beta-propeller fold protein YncE